jgi:hypothetical protein
MDRVGRGSGPFVGTLLGSVAVVALLAGAGAVACNGLLGIQSATVGDIGDAGQAEAGINCPYYCQLMTQNCTGNDNTEYQGSSSLCLTMCNDLELDEGTLTDAGLNTLGCRVFYAQLAGTTDPADNCRFAGPLGGGQCGDRTAACSNFCSLDVPYCAGIGAPSYLSVNDCNQRCLGVVDAGGFPFPTDGGSTGIDLPDGTNTLNCRFYHLENAFPNKGRGTTHCPHTMPVSATCF